MGTSHVIGLLSQIVMRVLGIIMYMTLSVGFDLDGVGKTEATRKTTCRSSNGMDI
jgi:hypothetical protein